MKKFIFLIIGILLFSSSYSQNSSKMKQANYLFGFARILNWSEYQNNTFVINVYGQSSVTDYINTLSYKNTSGGHKITAKQVALNNILNCNILYIPKENTSQLGSVVSLLNGRQVLIVTEASGYTNSGADVSFSFKSVNVQDSVLSYDFNLQSIRAKNIKVSPEFIGYGMSD